MKSITLDNAGILKVAEKIAAGKKVLNTELAAARTAAKRSRFNDTVAQKCQDAFETQAAKDAGYTREP